MNTGSTLLSQRILSVDWESALPEAEEPFPVELQTIALDSGVSLAQSPGSKVVPATESGSIARLSLSLLGPLQVRLYGEPVNRFASNKVRALLAYLAVEVAHPHRRETLASLLWPDQPEQAARHSLRQALVNLRRIIGDRDMESPPLLTSHGTVQFNVQSEHWRDVAVFDTLLKQCKEHRHRNAETCTTCIEWLVQAAELYRGDFMEGFILGSGTDFDEWVLITRERLHSQALEVFSQLSHFYERHGDYEQARHYALRQVELEPWREVAHRQLMRLLALCEHYTAALLQYETCRQILAQELGVEPEEKTTELYYAIKAREFPNSVVHSKGERVTVVGSESRTLSRHHNLPLQLTPFIGRETELAQLRERLLDPACRLVTLVGLGGVGKTRLALAAAEQLLPTFGQGVWFVPLLGMAASGTSSSLAERLDDRLAILIANAMDVRLSAPGNPRNQLLDYIRDKELLILLDSFEHLTEEASFVLEILSHAPRVVVLVTSREPLNLRAERVIRVEGLPVPQTASEPNGAIYSSVQLFVEHANRAVGEFTLDDDSLPPVIQICQYVEGMPLGIELAAAWTRKLSLLDIVQRMQQSLDFLATSMRDVPERHRTMRVVFEESWRLLSASEQMILAQTSVFRGGFSQDAALTVTDATWTDLLTLVDKALLRRTAAKRYEMHELLRQFAAEKLAAMHRDGLLSEDEVRKRHSAFYLGFVAQRAARFPGREASSVLSELWVERDNIRHAWNWAAMHNYSSMIDQSLDGLARFYLRSSLFSEGNKAFEIAVQSMRAHGAGSSNHFVQHVLNRLLIERVRFLQEQSLFHEAIATAQEAASLAQRYGARYLEVRASIGWGRTLWYQRNYAAAQEHLEHALNLINTLSTHQDAQCVRQHELDERCLRAAQGEALLDLGFVYYHRGELTRSEATFEQALTICQDIGSQWNTGGALIGLGQVALMQGHYTLAGISFERALHSFREIENRSGEGLALYHLGLIFARQGNYARATLQHTQALQIFREVGQVQHESMVLATLGDDFCQQGEYGQAMEYLKQALQMSRAIGDPRCESYTLQGYGLVAAAQGDTINAQLHFEQALSISRKLGFVLIEAELLAQLGLLLHQLDDDSASEKHSREALSLAERSCCRPTQATALTNLGHALTSLGNYAEAITAYQQALNLRSSLGQRHLSVEPFAGLAWIALSQGNLAHAQFYADRILRYLEHQTPEGTAEPLRVYLMCYHVLQSNEDPRARTILTRAYNVLQARAATIPNPALKCTFLERVSTHRDIVTHYQSMQSD